MVAFAQQLTLFDLFDYIPALQPQPVPDRLCVGRFLHLGAGVQSSTLAEMIVEGELDRVDAAIFADTGNEPPWVYGQVWYLAGRLAAVNIPLIVVRKSSGGLLADAMTPGGRFASMPLFTKNPTTGQIGMLRRQCTAEYKIAPSRSYVRDWLLARGHAKRITDKHGRISRRVNRKVYIEDWYGISLDEFERAGRNRGAAWQRAVYPLIERRMRRADCVRWLIEHNLPVPLKSSCIVCPFHDAVYWAELYDHYPVIWEIVCQFDDWLRTPAGVQAVARKMRQPLYLHPACIPLREVDFTTNTPPVIDLCGDHCRTKKRRRGHTAVAVLPLRR